MVVAWNFLHSIIVYVKIGLLADDARNLFDEMLEHGAGAGREFFFSLEPTFTHPFIYSTNARLDVDDNKKGPHS